MSSIGGLEIHSYHCLCTSLLFSTTHKISSLPRRSETALDAAVILPLPPLSSFLISSGSHESDDEESEADDLDPAKDASSIKSRPGKASEGGQSASPLGYTLLLSMTVDRRPIIVRREDGFEKRFLRRCGRCRLVVGYDLDETHYTKPSGSGSLQEQDTASQKKEHMVSRVGKVIYLLPGGVLSTDAMAAAVTIGDEDIDIDRAGTAVCPAWE